MDLFSFEKTREERLEEYLQILRFNDEPLPASRVRSEWSDFLEIEMESSGWQAIWKIPRDLCEQFKIHYPNLVLVIVKEICYKLLLATVTVIGVQDDDIHLPETLEAELIELWPTKSQEYDTLDVYRTADCLDKFRFFYNNIWMPWDMCMDDSIDWPEEHLKPRLDLYFALHSGEIPGPKCAYIKGLIKEAKSLQTMKNNIEAEMSDNEEEEPNDPKTAKLLLRIHFQLKQLQEQIEICENNKMRDLLDISGSADTSFGNSQVADIYFVSPICTVEDHLKYVRKSQEFIPNTSLVEYCHNLETVLESCGHDNTVIISPGTYAIPSMIKIREKCVVKGIYSPSETKLQTLIENSYFISTFRNVVIENLTIDANNLQYAFIAAYGTLHLKNCVIVGDGKSVTTHGISISPNSVLETDHCEIYNFSTGILCNKDSKVILRDSVIRDCFWGMRILSGCSVTIINSSIKDCKENGILVNDDDLTEGHGDSDILKDLHGFKLMSSTIQNVKLANSVIKKIGQAAYGTVNDNHME